MKIFEKLFANYARAVSDGQERERLYKKYMATIYAVIVLWALCICVLVIILSLEDYMEQNWAIAVIAAAILAWLACSVVALCLWISFKRAYNVILSRPAGEGEMPEVISYRRKTLQDKKSTRKKWRRTWLVVGICVAAFVVCIVIDVVNDFYGNEVGISGTLGILFLNVGGLVLMYEVANVATKQIKEIDAERFAVRDVFFAIEEGNADENARIYYNGNSLMCGGASGGITLYLGKTLYGFEVDGESRRVLNFSSGKQPLEHIVLDKLTAPCNVRDGSLFVKPDGELSNGTCWRIRFDGGDRYDPESKNLLVGNFNSDLPVYRVFKNCYVQLSEEGALLGVLCSEISAEENKS